MGCLTVEFFAPMSTCGVVCRYCDHDRPELVSKSNVVVEDGILKLVSARQRGIWDQGAGRATSDWTLAESCKFVIRR
jgi:hypothetical protein